MTIHLVADDPEPLAASLATVDCPVETATPSGLTAGRADVVVYQPSASGGAVPADGRLASTVTALAASATVVFVYTDLATATVAVDAGADATVPAPSADGSETHLRTVVERFHGHRTRTVSPVLSALDRHHDLFFSFDPGGGLTEWNDTLERVTGVDADRLAGAGPTELFTAESTDGVNRAIGEAVVDGEARGTASLAAGDDPVPVEFVAVLVDRENRESVVVSARRLDRQGWFDGVSGGESEPVGGGRTAVRLVDTVVDAVTGTETREHVEQAVCDALTTTDLFRFAWIGAYEQDAERVEPRVWAGDGSEYLDDRPTAQNREDRRVTALGSVENGDTRIVTDVAAGESAEIWHGAAVDHGHRAAAVTPIETDETVYGSLCVYAERPGAFDGIDTAVFERLGSLIGYAIHNAEVRRSLVSDTVVELQFAVTDPEAFVAAAARQTDGRLDLVDTVQRPDGGIVQLFSVHGIAVETLEALAREAPVPIEVIADRDDEVMLRAVVEGESITKVLADAGGEITSITATDGECRITARLPGEGDVAEVLSDVRSVYEVELLSKRTVSRDAVTPATLRTDVRSHLTDRQSEVIRAAYNSGFFDWPREQSGNEMAEILDITPPTFHKHRRVAQRKLLEVLFDDGPGTDRVR